jgi:hypothetical protein
MTLSEGADRDDLQLWRVAANVLDKQRTADNVCSSSYELMMGLEAFHRKMQQVTKCYKLLRIFQRRCDDDIKMDV